MVALQAAMCTALQALASHASITNPNFHELSKFTMHDHRLKAPWEHSVAQFPSLL
jgi:hypothetical protein